MCINTKKSIPYLILITDTNGPSNEPPKVLPFYSILLDNALLTFPNSKCARFSVNILQIKQHSWRNWKIKIISQWIISNCMTQWSKYPNIWLHYNYKNEAQHTQLIYFITQLHKWQIFQMYVPHNQSHSQRDMTTPLFNLMWMVKPRQRQ